MKTKYKVTCFGGDKAWRMFERAMKRKTKTYFQNLIDTQSEMEQDGRDSCLVLVPHKEDGTPVSLPQYVGDRWIVDSEWLKECC